MARRTGLIAAILLSAFGATAQEATGPLHARPQAHAPRSALRADLHTWFIYMYEAQPTLPLMDDFSVDRTRHLDAAPGDPDVSLTDVVYHLEVGGASAPDMAFRTDTTWHYTVDTTQEDTVIITRVANPDVSVVRYDITQYPSPSDGIQGWPLYNIFDTVGVFTTAEDTIPLSPDILQDSLMVYTVAAASATYDMNGTPQPLVLWEEDDVYINGTYPIDPPTVGVATFDGLDRTGYPYNLVASSYGMADHLTSVPIDLTSVPGDSVYLSFFYQPQGRSGDDQVQPMDSLRLEMYAPDEDTWYLQWYTPYVPFQAFKQVMLPITDERFLKDGFRMRFSNKATLSGALDHWHLDYVRLGRDRTYDDTVIVDVAYVYPESSVLQPYTSMPFATYSADPAAHTAQNVTETLKNLDVNDRFISFGYEAGLHGDALSNVYDDGLNTSGNANSSFGALQPVNSAPANYVHDPALSDTCQAFYDVVMWTNTTPDINRYNDTIRFTQELSNYYAYDDGSAEWGYSLNSTGAKLAVRYDMPSGDSLRAVRFYFDPIFSTDDPTDGNFLLTVWSSLTPETIIHQNFTYDSPQYLPWGPNYFVEYPLDSTIWVPATFYVGWTQTNTIKMNLGLDKNRDNSDRIFYKTGTTFTNSSVDGSLMIRPVMASNCNPYAGLHEPAADPGLLVYPDPADASFQLAGVLPEGIVTVQLIDATGRAVRSYPARTLDRYDVAGNADGLYVVRLVDDAGRTVATTRLLIQH